MSQAEGSVVWISEVLRQFTVFTGLDKLIAGNDQFGSVQIRLSKLIQKRAGMQDYSVKCSLRLLHNMTGMKERNRSERKKKPWLLKEI